PDPSSASEHRALGQLLLLSTQLQEAARELRVSVQLDPNAGTSHYYLGTAVVELQQGPAALTEFQQAVRVEPAAEHHFALAACLMSLGKDSDALAEMEEESRQDTDKKIYNARKEELLHLMM